MGISNLKEQLARTILRNVRAQGHPYVELREDGKTFIFFCTLCLARCYSDSVLFNHLKGNLHTERLATARATLLKPNPWPFGDGVFFFQSDTEEKTNGGLLESKRVKLLDMHHVDEESLAIVSYGGNLGPDGSTRVSEEIEDHTDCDEVSCDPDLDGNGTSRELVIPAVLQKDEVSDLLVRHMGVGRIGARFSMNGISDGIHRIWCEWLGNKDFTTGDIDVVPEHDFAVVTFSYNYNLGRTGLFDAFTYLLPASSHSEVEDSASSRCKIRKSFSDPEDVSSQYDSPGEESQTSSNSNSAMLLSGNDDQRVYTRILSSKTLRKELREQQRLASERLCDICQQKMLPDKDVGALVNRKTGKLVCSSRNLTGAFHVFHISCLIHWILLCEVEIHGKQPVAPKAKYKPKRKGKRKAGEDSGKREIQETKDKINSLFCPECQGTGITIEGEKLEKPLLSLSEIFRCKIKLCDAHKAWMKSPEMLENCSVGFSFPNLLGEENQENVASLKLLHFYRAGD